MRRCTLEEVARLSGGRLVKGNPSLPVDRLHTDTRTLATGDCFVALRGERFDGHTFVPQVKDHGAVAALVSTTPASGHTNKPTASKSASTQMALPHTRRSIGPILRAGHRASSRPNQ